MLRWTLILCAVCVGLIVILALTRGNGGTSPAAREPADPTATTVERVAPPPQTAPAPEPKVEAAPVEELPPDQQVEDDAAAVGMTTVEPPAEPPAEMSP